MPALATNEHCTGCTACASVCPKGCITMTADENGFLYPTVDTEKCVSCGLCEKSCPIVNPPRQASHEPLTYAAYSKDEPMRLDSSSGGVFTELARTVLCSGGVVYGAAYNERFEVMHICAEDESGLAGLRGAKYAQSNLCGIFAQIRQRLDDGITVLFSGTPCQVAGLKQFLHREYPNLIVVDFVCHGVPSPMTWNRYLQYRADRDNRGALPTVVNLRSKETGWSRYRYSNVFEYGSGNRNVASSHESLYMKLFVGDYINRRSCADCRFKGYTRCSDLTIGDFWGIWDTRPGMDDNKGTSVVLIQSQKGAVLFDRIKNHCVTQPVSLEETSTQNPSMLKSSPSNADRESVLKLVREGDFEQCQKLFQSSQTSLPKKLLRKFKSWFLR